MSTKKTKQTGAEVAAQNTKAILLPETLSILQLEGRDAVDLSKISADHLVEAGQIVTAGQAVIGASVEIAAKYRDLVASIRTANIGLLGSRLILKGLGFHKVRISEIQKIAYSPDAVYSTYAAGNIGLKGALELVRGGVTTVAAVQLLPNVLAAGEDVKALARKAGKKSDEGRFLHDELDREAAAMKPAKKVTPGWEKRAEKNAAVILKGAALGKVLPQEWAVPGWQLVLVKEDEVSE